MLGKMKLREAVIIDKLDILKQNWVLPLDPVYKQIVKCGYWTMPEYENKIVISRLVTSLFATEAAWIGCQRYTHKQCRLLSFSVQQDSSLGCYCSIQKVLVARALVRPLGDKGCRGAEGKLQKGAGSWTKQTLQCCSLVLLKGAAPFSVKSLLPFLRWPLADLFLEQQSIFRHYHADLKHFPPSEGKSSA